MHFGRCKAFERLPKTLWKTHLIFNLFFNAFWGHFGVLFGLWLGEPGENFRFWSSLDSGQAFGEVHMGFGGRFWQHFGALKVSFWASFLQLQAR